MGSSALAASHLALLGVGQGLVLLLGVEDQRVHGEGGQLLLEGGALVRADKQALVAVAERGAHQHDLQCEARSEGARPGPGPQLRLPVCAASGSLTTWPALGKPRRGDRRQAPTSAPGSVDLSMMPEPARGQPSGARPCRTGRSGGAWRGGQGGDHPAAVSRAFPGRARGGEAPPAWMPCGGLSKPNLPLEDTSSSTVAELHEAPASTGTWWPCSLALRRALTSSRVRRPGPLP